MQDGTSLVFTLFRAQVFFPEQLPLLSPLRTAPEVLKAALLEKPTVDNLRGSWHVGNVSDIPPTGLYFAIGKQLPRRVNTLDDEGDFQDHAILVAPNTHALLDLHYQVLGIAKNSDLSPEPKSVARQLSKLLQSTQVVREHQARISIDLISDPTEFLEILTTAVAVTKFQVSYGLPNVWDADEDFQRPFAKTAQALGADRSTATFKGQDLDRSDLVKLTRAAAAVGKRAKAWVLRGRAKRAVAVTPKENPAVLAVPPPEASPNLRWAQATLEGIRDLYELLRSRG